jgi:SAM-dependent methyltransferase
MAKEKCQKKGNNMTSLIVGDMLNLPFRQETFDLIISQDVIEHIKQKGKAISEIAFSLKMSGKVLISTSNAVNPTMFVDSILPTNVSAKIIHLLGGPQFYEREGRLNPWNLDKVLLNHGLKVRQLLLYGQPPLGKPWIYEDFRIKPPLIFYVWILFNNLTNYSILKYFKEMIIVLAEKSKQDRQVFTCELDVDCRIP